MLTNRDCNHVTLAREYNFFSCIYNTNCRKDLLILGYSTSVVVGVDGCWVSSVFRCYFPPGRCTFIHHTCLVVTRSMLMTYFPRHAHPSWILIYCLSVLSHLPVYHALECRGEEPVDISLVDTFSQIFGMLLQIQTICM